ncbi:ras-associating and dilute domain-containing protein isoform X2 [Rhinichthys klamathensis goyatoka]|uniref:ras-associating and dilute domain-containing protein isoform X2 n=1 Tax=Rhinichthys klamathensis goyatoka TaxID=3034132 RepID=UPI0024B5FE75|nr:ras-associating and dilute domain-containing protein isoform X2 [Rhinichthys klamathensis goyatoka]
MFYGSSSASMSLPSKNRLKRQSRTFTQVLYRTLSYRDRRSVTDLPEQVRDDPAELSTQSSAPGVLKIFGDEISAGANYKSVLATPRSSAQELIKEALDRYSLNKASVCSYVLCDVIGRFEGPERRWRTECLRALGNNEKPLLLQDLWKPKEGYSRRFELRRRAEVEELAAKEKDTVTAGTHTNSPVLSSTLSRSGHGRCHRSSPRGWRLIQPCTTIVKDINAQARKLQRNRAKGTMTLQHGSSFCRSLSETSLNLVGLPGEEPKRYYSTLPGPIRTRSARDAEIRKERDGGGVKHSLYQSPHLLLLQGYNQQDCLVYLLNREQHTVGQETASARPNICLSSPDVLPLHCRIRRAVQRRSSSDQRLLLEPVAHGNVLVNFMRIERPTPLRHGDLLSFGAHYIFLYKDPLSAKPLPAQSLTRLRALARLCDSESGGVPEKGEACRMCGAVLHEPVASRRSSKAPARGAQKRKLALEFERAHEDALVNRVLTLIEPSGDDHKLTPAYLLCLCIKHSANTFPPGSFGKLLLKMSKRIQTIAWEKTKELAQKQAQHQDPASLSLLSISDLVPDLQFIFFWMSNAIEILYFIQQKSPAYMQTIELMDDKGSKESLLSATISANEEAMTILEEVIMYTFQQCVYYITKTLYVVLPGLLDCNPFGTESSSEQCRRAVGVCVCAVCVMPEAVRRVVSVFQTTSDLLQQYQVHAEIQSQMFAYLFFFTNVSLFNQLIDKGPARGWFQRSRVLQIQASVKMLLDWAKGVGHSHLAQKFFAKFCSAVSILATTPQQLSQMSWKALCAEHPSLKPVQLHRILTQYQLMAELGPLPIWQPSSEDEAYIYRTVDLLESFENHPPIVLPSAGFKVDLESDCVEDSIYRQLLYVRHFVWGLRTKTHPSNGCADRQEAQRETPQPHSNSHAAPPMRGEGEGEVRGSSAGLGGRGEGAGAEERPRDKPPHSIHHRNGTSIRYANQTQATDSSCILTPPNTPLYPEHTYIHSNTQSNSVHYPEHASQEHTHTHSHTKSNGCMRSTPEHKKINGFISNGIEGPLSGCGFPFPVPVSHLDPNSDDICSVFVVDLDKGLYGLGMGLIDGLHTPLNSPGIYIRTLIPDGPAAADGRLCIGDRILAVNGTSLIGADYQSAVDLIRLGGGRLRFLVAKSDLEVSEKISASSC